MKSNDRKTLGILIPKSTRRSREIGLYAYSDVKRRTLARKTPSARTILSLPPSHTVNVTVGKAVAVRAASAKLDFSGASAGVWTGRYANYIRSGFPSPIHAIGVPTRERNNENARSQRDVRGRPAKRRKCETVVSAETFRSEMRTARMSGDATGERESSERAARAGVAVVTGFMTISPENNENQTDRRRCYPGFSSVFTVCVFGEFTWVDCCDRSRTDSPVFAFRRRVPTSVCRLKHDKNKSRKIRLCEQKNVAKWGSCNIRRARVKRETDEPEFQGFHPFLLL